MRKALRWIAAILVVAAIVFWAVSGANRGFTVNNQPKKIVDPITGLEGTSYEKVFIPGVDFLAGVLLGAGLLAGASFLFRKKKLEPKPQLGHQ
jgi:LPXTG-motif cell wall-anchored protein